LSRPASAAGSSLPRYLELWREPRIVDALALLSRFAARGLDRPLPVVHLDQTDRFNYRLLGACLTFADAPARFGIA
jgi:hypothetical protein